MKMQRETVDQRRTVDMVSLEKCSISLSIRSDLERVGESNHQQQHKTTVDDEFVERELMLVLSQESGVS